MNNIASVISRLFAKHRIVFWYDTKLELRAEFESLILPGVETIELANNELAVKHRILREQPETKFLLYHAGPEPEALQNWLLDLQLASGLFQADQTALWLSELELGPGFMELAQAQTEFFSDETRRQALKARLKPQEETETSLRLKMLAVCANSGPRLDEITESLLAELAEGGVERSELIRRCGLEGFLWERLARAFGYQSSAPGVKDFAIELFKSCYALELEQPARLNTEALVFFRRWKDSLSNQSAFETLSTQCASLLNIENDLQARDYRALVEMDLFRLLDQKILSDLVVQLTRRTVNPTECAAILRKRRQSHWYAEFQHYYALADFASQFLKLLDESTLEMTSLEDGVRRYAQTWQRLDQLYRKTVYHYRKSGHASLLKPLMDLVENHYNTNYLLKLSHAWQPVVDACVAWKTETVPVQSDFFERFVATPFLNNKKKIYVIISDAFRYEVADELLSLVRREDRYEAELTPILGILPSYTQLGMAALLPNREISFAEDGSGAVNVDGWSTQGTPNRDRILKEQNPNATAIRADDLLSMGKDECRAFVRDNEVIYVYHNRIDAVGDKRESEEKVFEAVEEALAELLTIIKKLTAANATNLLVTADHGFIYQNRPIEESDFSSADTSSPNIVYLDRRFVLGKNLSEQPGLKKFQASQVGLSGEMEIQFPKSIQRLRLKGSGSRYVHGGTSLQEVVVPVLQINKKRESDTTQVEVDIIRGAGNLITAGQLSVTFYQTQPVTDKVRQRRLRAGIYSSSGVLISDRHDLVFDLIEADPRQRESAIRFMLTREADQFNNQEVILKLEEQVGETSHYQEYKSLRYTLRRSFASDFDF